MTNTDNLTDIEQPAVQIQVDINSLDGEGNTALFHAVASQNLRRLNELLLSGADPNKAGNDAIPPLVWAAGNNYRTCVQILLKQPLTDINARQKANATALFMAVSNKFEAMVDLLLAHGADPAICLSQDKTSPLTRAIADGSQTIVQKIVSARPAILNDESSFTEIGSSPLHVAAQQNELAMVSLFLDAGASIDALSTTKKATALFVAAQWGHVEVLRTLLQRGANYKWGFVTDSHGRIVSPLEQAARHGAVECVELLLSYPHCGRVLEEALHGSFSTALNAKLNHRQDLYKISELIKNVFDKQPIWPAQALLESKILSWEESYTKIMDETKLSEKEKQPYDKNSALRYALASIYQLLRDPKSCIDYLKRLNDELREHWENEHGSAFPNFDSSIIDVRIHQGIAWPIPKDDIQDIKKFKLLGRITLDKFKQYDMGDEPNQWSGFMPMRKSREMLLENVHFTENSSTINGLFHGNTHNIQRVILLFAMEKGAIPLTYVEDNELKKLKPKKVFSALMSKDLLPTDKEHAPLWSAVMDRGSKKYFSFCYPYHLHSFLLTNNESSLSTLKNYMLFGFCTKYTQLLKLHNHIYNTNYTNGTFFRELTKLYLDTYAGNVECAIQMMEKRNLSEVSKIDDLKDEGRRWSVIPKQYTPLNDHVKMYGQYAKEHNLFFATSDKNTVKSPVQSEVEFKLG